MIVYTCGESFEEMLTCVYEALQSRAARDQVRLQLEPVWQQEMFCEYMHVDGDNVRAKQMARAIREKISYEAYRQVYLAAMSYKEERLDAIYRFLDLGFSVGSALTDMLARPEVAWILELSRKSANEASYFREFTRFVQVGKVYVAHIEPKCNVTAVSAEHFADRMPSEYWIMLDDRRGIAAVHPKDRPFYMTVLTEREQNALREMARGDIYTDLWKEFFRSTGIEKRKNEKCQRGHMPLWYRKHATEFH